jgi:hypothetical protein
MKGSREGKGGQVSKWTDTGNWNGCRDGGRKGLSLR